MSEIKYPIGGYAPGNYHCTCSTCHVHFNGDKRAVQCEPCAVESLRKLLRPYDQHPVGAVWVKASERLPAYESQTVFRQHGNYWVGVLLDGTGDIKGNVLHLRGALHHVVGDEKIKHFEWLDESPAEQQVAVNAVTIVLDPDGGIDNVYQDKSTALKFCAENGGYTPITRSVVTANEQPGREVELLTFLKWLTYDSFLELIGGQWVEKTDVNSCCPYSQGRIIELFKEQKSK